MTDPRDEYNDVLRRLGLAPGPPTPFNSHAIRDWLFEDSPLPEEFGTNGEPVLVHGSGPFAEEEFTEFLTSLGIVARTFQASDSEEILIIGRRGCSEPLVNGLIAARSGERLRIYSQEMFLTFILADDDPFDAPLSVIEAFRSGHTGLEAISAAATEFDWPSAMAPESGPTTPPILPPLPEEGLLRLAGYKTGKTGIRNTGQRQFILQRVFRSDDLRRDFGAGRLGSAYLAEWGSAESSTRLRKMADSIAAFCRNNRRKQNAPDLAIQHWEQDLAWLRRTFYLGRFDRNGDWWPTTKPPV